MPDPRVLQLFREARELPPDSQETFLQNACDSDTILRDAVRRLLALWKAEGDDEPPPLPADVLGPEQERADWTGQTVGKYRVVSQIGKGGMGVVYLAEQAEPRRCVALKVLLSGEDSMRQRFRFETDVLAGLKHPNVITIFGVDRHDGFPYFSMDYVEGGLTLDGFLRRDSQPLPAPREAARFAATVCRAIDAAHRAGVIHRDLKPANVLLRRRDGKPGTSLGDFDPVVTDFGLARRIAVVPDAGPPLTVAGFILGTPAYLSPEQASQSAVLTVACDVHALGLLLYETLTGKPPFHGANLIELLVAIREQEPAGIRAVRRDVPGDLETVCLKCLRKDPAQRYATAAALADDLERFLAGEPIAARPTSALARSWMWARRRPAAATLLALLPLATVALAVLAAGLAWQRNRAETRARENLVLLEDLAGRSRRVSQALAQAGDLEEAQAEAGRAAETYRQVLRQSPTSARAGLAASLIDRGKMLRRLTRQEPALPLFEEALELLSAPGMTGADNDVLRVTARSQLGYAQVTLKQTDEGVPNVEAGRAEWQRLLDEAPSDRARRAGLAEADQGLGEIHQFAKDFDKARQAYQQSKTRWAALHKENPSEPCAAEGLATATLKVGDCLTVARKPREALAEHREALKPLRVLRQTYPGNVRYAQHLDDALLRVAGMQLALRDYDAMDETLRAISAVSSDELLRKAGLYALAVSFRLTDAMREKDAAKKAGHEAKAEPWKAEAVRLLAGVKYAFPRPGQKPATLDDLRGPAFADLKGRADYEAVLKDFERR